MAAPTYQTARFSAYSEGFRRVARELFELASRTIPSRQTRQFDGSYSIFGTTSAETMAKIIIYERYVGKRMGTWPDLADGVYILVRGNGNAAKGMWQSALWEHEIRGAIFLRLKRNRTLAVAPHHKERFRYFPVMAGEDFQAITTLLEACSQA